MVTPISPRSPINGHSADRTASTSSLPVVKPKRTVRLFAQLPEESSSDEEGPVGAYDGQDGDGEASQSASGSTDVPGSSHHATFPGPSKEPGPSRISAIVSSTSIPKLTRTNTTASTASSSRTNSSYATAQTPSSVAPPPAPAAFDMNYEDWRNKYRLGRTPSSRTVSSSSRKVMTPGEGAGVFGSFKGKGGLEMTDPDINYFGGTSQRSNHLDGAGSDDERVKLKSPPKHTANGESKAGRENLDKLAETPITVEGTERIQWRTMLSSILAGDILIGESSRIGEDKPGDETFRREVGSSFWWQIRAKIRGRTEDEEKRRVEERRSRVVDAVLEEVDNFEVRQTSGPVGVGRRLSAEFVSEMQGEEQEDPPDPEHEPELAALDQVTLILQKLSFVEALYPHHAAFRASKPLYDTEAFQARVAALTAWSTVVTSLQGQLLILQKWTGTDDVDVTRPNTTKEKALVGTNRYHPLDTKAKAQASSDAADDSTFLERIMKEESLQRTFDKRVFADLVTLVRNAKDTVVDHLPIFETLKLPDFQYELVRLIGFPGRLIIEALKVRLDAAAKLVDPNPMVINDMIDNFRLAISLAVLIKEQYEDTVKLDEHERWKIPHCLPPEYDSVLLDGLRTFFKLLHWKLKSGSRTIYFRETEVLEDEWEFLYEAAEAVPGGDLVVAEHFCSLTNKLMVRVCNYFDSQLRVPTPSNSPTTVDKPLDIIRKAQDNTRNERKAMTPEEMLVWYGKVLDAVRMRYRKLQRFARRLTQRFDNSAEYALEDDDLDTFIKQLQESGHFLVYTKVYEERGTYIMADGSLWNNPSAVTQILQRSFSIIVPTLSGSEAREPPIDETIPEAAEIHGTSSIGDRSDMEEDLAGYLLLLSPRQNFAWTGAVMTLDLNYTDFALEDNRVRLIADGPTSRLALCKRLFAAALVDPETAQPVLSLSCLVEAQAHLPRIQRELKRIARSNYRLTESFIESAAHVRSALTAPGAEDMVEAFYQFSSEHGKRAKLHIEPASQARFCRLLMRLAISWVSFICDSCDPTDRKTFRWTVSALRFALEAADEVNILQLEPGEFSLLRKSVASLVSLLISHFDILGARSSMEAKKEADKVEAMRRLQRLQENFDDDFNPRALSPTGRGQWPADRSIRLVREERLRLINELEAARVGLSIDQHLLGQVLDEQVSEDRALVFLAASASNIALRWQQGQFIGGGANGNVYIGFNLDSGGVMAVKEIRVQDLSNSPALYKQIKDESDVMSMLSHPNIVEYFGIEVHRDRVFIFQEFCEGGSLANQLEHGRIEDEDVVVLYALQMLQGLQYLHSKGIEHRDVKPENILLGTNSTIKFVDFGAAKVIAKGNRTMAKTRAMRTKATGGGDGPAVMNSLAGTPMYMAPEMIRPTERKGQLGAADIWSMGCVLLEISTGRKPWSNLDNEWAIMFHIGVATQAPPLPEPGQLSDLGIDFIDRCLTLDPPERPSADQLLYDSWLATMVQHLTEYGATEDASSGGGHSATSTLVDHSYETQAYAAQMEELAHQQQEVEGEDLGSFESTPQHGTSPVPVGG